MSGKGKSGGTTDQPTERKQRLAQALRQNLRRRKDQTRRRKTDAPDKAETAPDKE